MIGLVFKLCKSYCGLKHIAGYRREHILVELYAKLIGVILTHFLVAPLRMPYGAQANREISPVKVRKIFQGATTATVAIEQTYNAWAAALHTGGEYADAMSKFTLATQATSDENVVVVALAGYDDALWTLAHLTDATGVQIINDVLATACGGEAAVSPTIDLAADQAGKAAINSHFVVPPPGLKAVMLAHFRYAVCLTTGYTGIQRCAYTNGYVLVRRQGWWKVTVRDAKSGAWLAENMFYASMPKNCPANHLFYDKIAHQDGGQPSSADVVDWLRGIIG